MYSSVAQKRKFIRELSKNIIDEALKDVERAPPEWDGIELRRWLALRFERACIGDFHPRRQRAFRSAVDIFNL